MPPYNEGSMHTFRAATLCCALLACIGHAFSQAEFRVYQEHPRLFLEPARLARLRKDIDRQTLRWQSLHRMIAADAPFPEQPLVDALLYQIEADEEFGQAAVASGLRLAGDGIQTAAELREVALVYDWCHGLLDSSARAELGAAMAAAIQTVLPQANLDTGLIRAAILASIALAGDWASSESALAELLGTHWQGDVRSDLERGALTDDGAALIAVLETSLAVRHNLEIDLLGDATEALASLVRTRLLSYYPVDIETNEGRARRPSRFGTDEPRARVQAPLYRIADMLLVAYESNLREFQFLQGWIRDDNYLLRSPLTAPYEFLWVNPYLPGLTPQSAPLLAHDPLRGRVYSRQSWQRPTTWIGYADGRLEILTQEGLLASSSLGGLPPMFFPEAVLVPVEPPAKVNLSWQPSRQEAPEFARIFLIGLQEGETYSLKVGNREAQLVQAEAGGILVLRSDRKAPKRNRIDLRKRIRLQLRPTLKPTDPRRPRPTLAR